MNQTTVEDKIIAYFEGEMGEKEQVTFLESLEKSSDSLQLFEFYQTIYEDFAKDAVAIPSAAFVDDFYAKLEQEQTNKSIKTHSKLSVIHVMKYAAAILILVTFGTLIGLNWSKNQQLHHLNGDLLVLKNEMTHLLQNKSTAVRIKAVNMSNDLEQSNEEIMNVLIKTMNGDASENVRLVAIAALEKFAEEPIVKKAFLKALETQKDDFIQIKLIHILANLKEKNALQHLNEIIENKKTSKYLKREATLGKETINL